MDLSALDGSDGFALTGADVNDSAGHAVSDVGDINADGYSDIVISAFKADANGDTNSGETYVILGKASGYDASVDLATLASGNNGFVLRGVDASDESGVSVSAAGDINGDGYSDIIVGAYGADTYKGETYVLYGRDFTGDETITGAAGVDPVDGRGDGSDLVISGDDDDDDDR